MGKQGAKTPEPSKRQVLLAVLLTVSTFAVLIGLLVGINAVVGRVLEADKSPEEVPPAEIIETPIDVRMLYNDPDWTFERSGTLVSVTTDIYMDEDGREAAKNVCNLTLGDLVDVQTVVVSGLNGREYCKQWRTQ